MKRLTIIIGLMALTGCLMGEAHGQAVATLSADTIALGDQTTLSIRNALNYPSTDLLTAGGIVALDQTFDTATRTQKTVLTSFEPGEHVIHLSPYDSLTLVVTDVPIDTNAAELRDIAPIQRVPYTFWEIFRWVLLAWGVAIAAILLWWLFAHRKNIKDVFVPQAPVDTRDPHQRAADSLEELRRKQLWQSGKVKEYHTELTDIVRRFIEEATGIRATDMTSDETIDEVKSGKWYVEISLLRNIFTTADLVKFAKSEPLPHEHDRSLADAVRFVNELWEAAKPSEEAPAAKKEEEAAHD